MHVWGEQGHAPSVSVKVGQVQGGGSIVVTRKAWVRTLLQKLAHYGLRMVVLLSCKHQWVTRLCMVVFVLVLADSSSVVVFVFVLVAPSCLAWFTRKNTTGTEPPTYRPLRMRY